jgi:hypothetical protein
MGIPPAALPPSSTGFGRRLIGAVRLDPAVYEEVEADRTAIGQAIAVVVVSSVAAGIGARQDFNHLVVGVLASLFSWYIWAILTWFIGTRLLPVPTTRATPGELLRTLGFASAPGVVQIAGLLPALHGFSVVVAALWMLAAGVIAVRQALDYEQTWRALAVVGIGWLVQWSILGLLLLMSRAA